MKTVEKGYEDASILVVLNNDDEPIMEYKLNGICEDPESSYWTMDPSEIFSVWSTPYLMGGDTEMNPCNCGDWISVTDQYPDKEFYDWVLVSMVTVEDETFRLVPEVAEWREDHWATVDTDDLEREMFVRVTHWTRLPDNPK